MLAIVTGADDHVLRNRAVWDQWAAGYADAGTRNWAAAEPSWGIWKIAETQAGVLPPDLEGLDSIEPASGAIRTAGSPKRPGCCAPAVS